MHYNTKDVLEGGWLQLLWEHINAACTIKTGVTCSIQYLWMNQVNGSGKLKQIKKINKNKDMTHLSLCTTLINILNNILGAYSNIHKPTTT